jgi:hypothetical protein
MLLATYCHVRSTLPYVLSSFLIYLTDLCARFYKSHHVTATLYTLPALDSTFVEIPSISGGWRAGQHIRLRVLSSKMGWFGWAEPHPFTIASIPTRNRAGAVQLYVKKHGDWTRALYKLAGTHEGDVEASWRKRGTAIGRGKVVRVIVEGPYGGTGNPLVSSFSAALIVVAGSGITFALAHVRDILEAASRASSRIRILDVVWVVQDRDSVVPLIPTLSSLLFKAERTATIECFITIHFTRAPSTSTSASAAISAVEMATSYTVPRSLIIKSGRPDLGAIAQLTVVRAAELLKAHDEKHGVLMVSCGPASLNEGVRKVSRASCEDKRMMQKVGGVEFHAEAFA